MNDGAQPPFPRGKPSSEGRFVWIASLAAERIVNELGATEAAFGMGVYIALARLSSKQSNNPRLEESVQKIAGLARLSYPKTAAILDALESKAKVISIERRPRGKGEVKQPPHVYTLLSCRPIRVVSGTPNGVSSGRHNAATSGRRNGGGTPLIQASERNPHTGVKKENKPETASLGGSALEAQPPSSGPSWIRKGLDD